MNEKEKGKSQPFAGVLYPDEDLLWQFMYDVPALSLNQRLSAPMKYQQMFTLILLGGLGLLVAIASSLREMPFSVILLVPVFAFILFCLWPRETIFTVFAYAITNERLLHRYGQDIADLPLEAVPPIEILANKDNDLLLHFGTLFPVWEFLPDTLSIKHMIEQAQAQRKQQGA